MTTAEIIKIQRGKIDETEINKVKQTRLNRLDDSFEENSYWMFIIGTNLTQGDKILTLEEARARTNAINKEDLQKAAQKYLKPENRLQFVLMPQTTAANAGQTKKGN